MTELDPTKKAEIAMRAYGAARAFANEVRSRGIGADDLSDDGDLTEFIVYGSFNLLDVFKKILQVDFADSSL